MNFTNSLLDRIYELDELDELSTLLHYRVKLASLQFAPTKFPRAHWKPPAIFSDGRASNWVVVGLELFYIIPNEI